MSFTQASSRISSFDQNPASGKMPERLSVPIRNVQKVIGITVRRPPISRMSNVLVAWFTEPLPRNSSALKKACVNRWKIATAYPNTPSASIM